LFCFNVEVAVAVKAQQRVVRKEREGQVDLTGILWTDTKGSRAIDDAIVCSRDSYMLARLLSRAQSCK
jgi:hypothetical protein